LDGKDEQGATAAHKEQWATAARRPFFKSSSYVNIRGLTDLVWSWGAQ